MADNKQVENDEEIKTKSKAKLLLVIGIVIALIVAIGCYVGALRQSVTARRCSVRTAWRAYCFMPQASARLSALWRISRLSRRRL